MEMKYTWRTICGKNTVQIIVLLCATSFMIGLAACSASMIAAILVNSVVYVQKISINSLIILVFVLVLCFIFIIFFRKIIVKKLIYIRENLEERVFTAFLNDSILEEYDKEGEVISNITEDKNKIINFLENNLSELIESIVVSAFMGIMVFCVNKVLFIYVLLFSVISASSYLYAKKIKEYEIERMENVDMENKSSVMLFQMIEILNFYKFSKRLFENHKRIVHDRSKKELQKENIIILFDTISYLCNILRELSVIFYGVMYAGMNIGMVIAMLNITSFFGEIARAFGEYQMKSVECSVSVERIMRLPEIAQKERTHSNVLEKGNVDVIKIKDLSYRYKNGRGLKKCSYFFEKNKINVVIGRNGTGKSTLIKILCGLITPQTGAIFFDNKKQSEEELKGNTAYVDQENILLEGTVIDNITGFSEEPNEKLVAGLLDELGLEEWVATLANRMYHNLSSELTNLSGGERQRLSIARALYKNCPIIVMDEPVASLDMGNKEKFWKILNKIKINKILIIVSHDEELLKHAENICVLE